MQDKVVQNLLMKSKKLTQKLILAHFEAEINFYPMGTFILENWLTMGFILRPKNWVKCQNYTTVSRSILILEVD